MHTHFLSSLSWKACSWIAEKHAGLSLLPALLLHAHLHICHRRHMQLLLIHLLLTLSTAMPIKAPWIFTSSSACSDCTPTSRWKPQVRWGNWSAWAHVLSPHICLCGSGKSTRWLYIKIDKVSSSDCLCEITLLGYSRFPKWTLWT